MPQDLVEIQVEQPQKEDNYQEYTELENIDGFRFEADIYVSWNVTQRTPALVPVAGKNTPKL